MVELHKERVLEVNTEGSFAILNAESAERGYGDSLCTHLEVVLHELSDIVCQSLLQNSAVRRLVVFCLDLFVVFCPRQEHRETCYAYLFSFIVSRHAVSHELMK